MFSTFRLALAPRSRCSSTLRFEEDGNEKPTSRCLRDGVTGHTLADPITLDTARCPNIFSTWFQYEKPYFVRRRNTFERPPRAPECADGAETLTNVSGRASCVRVLVAFTKSVRTKRKVGKSAKILQTIRINTASDYRHLSYGAPLTTVGCDVFEGNVVSIRL